MAIDLPAHADTPHENPGGTPDTVDTSGPFPDVASEPITDNGDTEQRPDPHALLAAMAAMHAVKRQQRHARQLRILRIIGLVIYALALIGIYGLLAFFGLVPTLIDY